MRTYTACASFALLASVIAILFLRAPIAAQQGSDVGVTTSSLDLGNAFDRNAKHVFEQQLSSDERDRLIALNSRFVLADPENPLPTSESRQPFYLKLRADMTREFADALAAAGCSFIGYANAHTHFLRARDGQSLTEIKSLIDGHALVVGTLLQNEADMMSEAVFDRVYGGQDLDGVYTVLFWRDLSIDQMAETLELAEAVIVDGGFTGASPLVTVRVPSQGTEALIGHPNIELLGLPTNRVTTNVTSTAMSSADPATIGVSPYNLDGTGEVAGVWDAGIARESHLDYQTTNTLPSGWGSNSRIWNKNSGSTHYHAAHVTGTVAGDGAGHATGESKGYAYEALCLVHNWNNVDNERREARHEWNHSASNHSYSSSTNSVSDWGGYNGSAQLRDLTNRDILACMVQSAGNYATGIKSGFANKPFGNSNPTMSIAQSNGHRNGFIAAAAKDNRDIASFSSRGPGLDGRLQPQFCANGVSMTSSYDSADDAYGTISGTSMSGPSICGNLVLLSQLWKREHNDQLFTPDVARAVVAQTCDDEYHAGPDYHFGFGIVNCKAAADLILADKANGGKRIVRGTTRSGDITEYEFTSNGVDPIHVVLNWLDIYASTGAAITLVNDLDIELKDPNGSTYFPYSGVTTVASGDHTHVFTTTGPNTRDNIEMVHVDSPMAGTWTLRVKGTSIPANPQTNMPNDATGFVIASSHELDVQKKIVEDSVNGGTAVSIPDNNSSGITRTIAVSDNRFLTGVRLHIRIKHERRGDLAIQLEHPDSTVVDLKTANNHTGSYDLDNELDLIAVFPDTKQSDDDVVSLLCKPAGGNWKVHITDNTSGDTGVLEYLTLELDVRTNVAPVADAGVDFDERELNTVQLDAGTSSDADNEPISFSWTQTGGTSVSLSATNVAAPTFTAPSLSADEVLTFEVTVMDCPGFTDTDTVQVTIKNNLAPTTDAGADSGVLEQQAGALDASGTTDPEGDSIGYSWAQTAGAITLSLSSSTAIQPMFTAPAVTQDEICIFELTTLDSRGDSSTDTVVVTIEANRPPVANAGPDLGAIYSAPISLDGSRSSDPNTGDIITYQWVQISGTATVTLTGASTVSPSLTAPATDDVLVFELTVTDILGMTATDKVAVHVNVNGTVPQPKKSGKGGGGGCVSDTESPLSWLVLLAACLGLVIVRWRRTIV
ncbi:S8 family serine peptidase [Planctomycetota bacterium]|nr:S8 family serine peptidase [Planctomycetota bacterium]